MDLDLRKLRYFAAVAEQAHFGRAAEQLYIAQPVLSRQIRALEQELGCALLERTTRSVKLTTAGRQLYEDAPAVLAAASAATKRVHTAARGVERLVVGFAPGLSVNRAVAAFAAVHPDVEVELLYLRWHEQAEALLDGRADVAYLRGRFEHAEIDAIEVGTELRVACLLATHPLAAKRRLRLADLEGELMLDTEARKAGSSEEKFELVAAGRGIVLVPRSVARYYSRPGLVYRPVTDVPADRLCVGVATGRNQPYLREFVTVAVETLRSAGPRP